MRSGSRTPKAGREAGSTTLEALLAVAILAVAGSALLSSLGTGLPVAAAAAQASRAASELLLADDAFRREVGRVRVPLWERGALPRSGEAMTEIGWYGGVRGGVLSFSDRGEAGFAISSGEAALSFPRIRDARVLAALPRQGVPQALELRFVLDGRGYAVIAPLGSAPLPKEGRR